MALKLKVSNIACEEYAEIITESIHVMEPEVKVDVDINAKTVTVESEASEESIKQVIVAAGYAVEGYRSDSSFLQKKFRL
ncbi:heavy-metal-associated domain-containing protein [Nostoc sp. LPT]|uniref:heavy-metal-associated domain-containing protein n=1 Tax=Nostoc sp. LPT TaxID=2815387 RepID=UPI001D9DF0CD|nr:heavy-metal-associated domain-containing protein [Nostoc sp. LPT]MBN4001139.1 heavy-metal-associated domain-containing protein [Nostoc sp. LPT]